MIEAVIWDFGGVITASPFEAFNRYEAERGLPKDLIRGINAANIHENAWAKFERSEVDLEGFDKLFASEAKALGHDVPGRDVLGLLHGAYRPEMIEALQRVSKVFKTGCITNNMPSNQARPTTGRDQLYAGDIMAIFDHVIESAKIGVRKPDPAIYRMMCEALKVEPDKCVFLDDLGVNLKPAREMGMKTIKVVESWQAISELEAITHLKLRD